MGRFNPIQNSFVAGELSSRLEARDDLEQYHHGMRWATNGIVLPHGGFSKRSGSRFVKEVKDSADAARLLPFRFSVTQAYVQELGDQYIRFYTNEARLESGGSPVEVVSPYLHTELRDIQHAQDADVQWQVHPAHYPRKLERTSATEFTLTKIAFKDGKAPLLPANLDTSLTLTITGSDSSRTLTWSSDIGLTTAKDVGRAVRVFDTAGSEHDWWEITAVTNGSTATATIKGNTATNVSDESDWALGAFSDSEGPRAVTFHEGRLWFGGAPQAPDRFWGSRSDDFDNFDGVDTTDNDASISRRTVGGDVSTIQWLASGDKGLLIGTAAQEFIAKPGDEDFLTPASTNVRKSTKRGSAHVQPDEIDAALYYVHESLGNVREFAFQFIEDRRLSRDISILAEHVLRPGGGVEMRYQQTPDSVLWVTRGDGQLVGFTIEQEQKVIGAHRHITGGNLDGDDAEIESATVIPAPNDNEDQLWWVAKRTIDGSTVRYVEFVENPFRPNLTHRSTRKERVRALEDAFMLDSGVTVDNPLTIESVSGFEVTITGHGLETGDTVKLRDSDTDDDFDTFFVVKIDDDTIELFHDETTSAPWDVTAIDFPAMEYVDVNASPEELYWSPGGDKVFVQNGSPSGLSQFDATVAWDLLSVDGGGNSSGDTVSATATFGAWGTFDGANATLRSFAFKPDGRVLYAGIGKASGGSRFGVRQFPLTAAHDLTAVGVNDGTLDFGGTTGSATSVHSLAMRPDGTRLITLGIHSATHKFRQYNLAEAWDVTSYADDATSTNSGESGNMTGNPVSAFWKPDGLKVFVVFGTSPARVDQHDVATAWDVTTINTTAEASYTMEDFPSASQGKSGVFWRDDGTRVYVSDAVGTNIYQLPVQTREQLTPPEEGVLREEVEEVTAAHLVGQVVCVIVDGSTHPSVTVSAAGTVTLNRPGSIIHAGLHYDYAGETQRFAPPARHGTTQGEQANVARVTLRLLDTMGGEVAIGGRRHASDALEPITWEPFVFNKPDLTPMDEPPALFYGDVEVPLPGGWSTEPSVAFRQPYCLPMTVLAVVPHMEVGTAEQDPG